MNQGLGFSLTPGVAPIQASLHNTESNVSRGRVRGGREGALAPPDLPKIFYFIFTCVVVKCGDLIEIVINSA